MHSYQYEQFDVSYLDFIKLAFSNQRFRNLIGRDNIKIFTSNRPYILLSLMKMSTPEMTRLWKKKMNPTRLGNRRTMIIHQKRSRMRSKGLKLITPLWILMKKKLSVRIKTLSTLVKVLIILLNRIN